MMKKLKMTSSYKTQENIDYIYKRFPNLVSEVLINGKAIKKIDFDLLKQELSSELLEGRQERYQLNWPDKKKALLLANSPINGTLIPNIDESINFNSTSNVYIEGDNLDVLKLLRDTYMSKIKVIYIDPPYNTGSDFLYEDDYSSTKNDYFSQSDYYDNQGNRMNHNTESNGRFHTDWLNMIYPRLKIAKDLLSDDGAIFIHIDEHEVYNLSCICNEIFGRENDLGTIIWDKRNPKGSVGGIAYQHESILCYCKNFDIFKKNDFSKKKEHASEMVLKVSQLLRKFGKVNDDVRSNYKEWLKSKASEFSGGELAYSLIDDEGNIYRTVSMAAPDKPETRSHRPLIHPKTNKPCPIPSKGWRYTDKTMDELLRKKRIEFGEDHTTQPTQIYLLKENLFESVSSVIYYGGSDDALGLPFDNPKPLYISKKIINFLSKEDDIILDFFSGSATTAHAVMKLNSEDGKNRKFILVQIPEECKPESKAFSLGFKDICQVGKERIQRASKEIHESNPENNGLDLGFRVFKIDSSNMKDVYYNPSIINQNLLSSTIDNVKEDRTSLDLLFQVMLDLGIELSAKIEEKEVNGKKFYLVNENYLSACFDLNIDEKTIREIAKYKPVYAVFRDASFESDSSNINCEQIIKSISISTELRVL